MKRLALALALLSGACTLVGPDYQRPAQVLPADYPEVPAGAGGQIGRASCRERV